MYLSCTIFGNQFECDLSLSMNVLMGMGWTVGADKDTQSEKSSETTFHLACHF